MKVTQPSQTFGDGALPLADGELKTLLMTSVENLTVGQLKQLVYKLKRTPGGEVESSLIGVLLTLKEK